MKFIGYISVLALLAGTAQAQTNPVITPGANILAELAAQKQNQSSLSKGDTVADNQGGTGYLLTGEVIIQTTATADVNALMSQYGLQLKHWFGNFIVGTSNGGNLLQLVARLQTNPDVVNAGYDLREWGLSPDPEVKNDPN